MRRAMLPGTLRVTDHAKTVEKILTVLCDGRRRGVKGALTALTAERLAPGFGPPDGYQPASYGCRCDK